MKMTNVDEAVKEAKRFIKCARALDSYFTETGRYDYCAPAAALKRASMDLTRALAKMRNGR